jgi:replicative DNA helicase
MTDNEFEQVVIKTIYANPSASSKIVPELDPNWFIQVDHKYIVDAISSYNSKYSTLPNAIEIKRLLSDERSIEEFEKCMAIPDSDVNTPFILDEIQTFVRKRLGRQVCMAYNEYCSTGKAKISFADEMAYAQSFTFDDKIGFAFCEEPEKVYNGIITNEKVIPLGCATLDEMIHGGVHEQSLTLIMAPTNIGKTLFLCSMSSAMLLAGKRVMYVTFEDPEVKIGQRIMQNLMDKTQTELKSLNKDAYMRLFNKMLGQIGHNKLKIKEYPEYCVSSLQLKALIKEYKEKHNFKPDVIMLDYIGCMVPDGRVDPNMNDNSKLRAIAAQVRSIGLVEQIPIISAMQSNRGGYGKAEIGLDDAADSFGQTMKADAIFGVTQTPEMKAADMYSVKLLKTRYGMPKTPIVTIGVDIEKQKIYDLKTFNNNDIDIGSNSLPEPPSAAPDVNAFDL